MGKKSQVLRLFRIAYLSDYEEFGQCLINFLMKFPFFVSERRSRGQIITDPKVYGFETVLEYLNNLIASKTYGTFASSEGLKKAPGVIILKMHLLRT